MTSGSRRTSVGRAAADHPPGLQAVDAVADRHHERHVVLDHEHRGAQLAPHLEQERPERLGLPLGDAGGGLVEAQHPGVRREEARQLDDPAHAGGQLVDEALGVRSEPEEVEHLVGVGLLGPLDPPGLREARARRWRSERERADSAATWTVSRTVRSPKSAASWKVRPRPSPARRGGLIPLHLVPEHLGWRPCSGRSRRRRS